MITFKGFLKESETKAPLPNSKKEIEDLLWEYEECISGGFNNCEIVDTIYGMAVNVKGNVNLKSLSLPYLPFRFNNVKGNFDVSFNKELLTIEGAPKWVSGYANFEHCSSLKNLDYLTKVQFQTDGVANFSACTELERIGTEGGFLYTNGLIVSKCPKLDSIERTGTNFGNVNIVGTNIHSFHDFHKQLIFGESGPGGLTLYNGHDIQDITDCGLNLMQVKNLKEITYSMRNPNHAWCAVIEKGLENNEDIFDVQSELIDAGFKEHAKL